MGANKAKAEHLREEEGQADEEAISEGTKAKAVEKRAANSVKSLKEAANAAKKEMKKDKELKLPAPEADRKEEGQAEEEADKKSGLAEADDGAKAQYSLLSEVDPDDAGA